MNRENKKISSEKTLRLVELATERKVFLLAIKENHRGRFVRIVEQNGTGHSTIIIPLEVMDAFIEKLTSLRSDGLLPLRPAAPHAASS